MRSVDETRDEALIPYRHPFPADALADMMQPDALADDERLWVPQSEHIYFKPLCLSVSGGYYVNLLRVKRAGFLSRHRHSGPVHAMVLKGEWYYLEHEWNAVEGSYVFEPPGETHTLVVPEGVEEMITFFYVSGSLIYVDPDGNATGYDDVFTKIDMCCAHYESVGLGTDYVKRFIR